MKRWIALGAVLIVVGLASFVANLTGVGAQILQPGLLSLAGLAAGLASRGFLGDGSFSSQPQAKRNFSGRITDPNRSRRGVV